MSSPFIICGPLPELKLVNAANSLSPLWDIPSVITISFLDGTSNQCKYVKIAFFDLIPFVDLNFQFVNPFGQLPPPPAQIRVSFSGPGAWSAIGKHALEIVNGPTMCLGFVHPNDKPSPAELAMIRHQVGHALGMVHEWDARGVQLIETEENKPILEMMLPFKDITVSNFPRIDTESVMNYWLPPGVVKGRSVEIPSNSKLSESDEAWLFMNYSRGSFDDGVNGIQWTITRACNILGLSLDDVPRILSEDINIRRAEYAKYISECWELVARSDSEEVMQTIASIVMHPTFHSCVARLVQYYLMVEKGVEKSLDEYQLALGTRESAM